MTLHVGTYAKTGGKGLYCVEGEPSSGWTLGTAFEAAPNASFGAYSQRYDLHYLVDEQERGAVAALRAAPDGWKRLARVETGGDAPCYLALDAAEKMLAVANYGSGSIALFRLDPRSGLPVGPAEIAANRGRGPDPKRQEGPHAHCALFSPEDDWLYQTDLGTDEILAFAIGRARDGLGEPVQAFRAAPGSGPRHIVFHPAARLALLASELASTLSLLEIGSPAFDLRQQLPTAPRDFAGDNLVGHLAINRAGDRVYVSNRGHHSIAVFALGSDGLSLLQHISSRGSSPRFFLLQEDRHRLIVANEQGNSIAAFTVAADGRLAALGDPLHVPGAAWLFDA